MTDTTATDTPGSTALKPWQRGGPTPNPLGRKRGTPNKFSRAFLADVAEKWHTHGASVLEEVRRDDPATFLRVCASLVPREILLTTQSATPVARMSETELQALIVEDVTGVERLKAKLSPLIDRVASYDTALAAEIREALHG
jgi:hypothetical protein